MKKGIAYGVGVGPGDPELITLKALRIICENEVIAVPGKNPKASAAYKIAVQSIPQLADKELVPLDMPMVKDRELLGKTHLKCAKLIKSYLDKGNNVVFITLGDPTIYCTFSYIQHILESDGYQVELVSGVTSFCAAAARLNIPLAEWNEQLHVIPAVHMEENLLCYEGNYVLMKSASQVKKVKEILKQEGKSIFAVENCGMENERIYYNSDEIPDDAGYFSLIIAKHNDSQ